MNTMQSTSSEPNTLHLIIVSGYCNFYFILLFVLMNIEGHFFSQFWIVTQNLLTLWGNQKIGFQPNSSV